MRTPLYIIAAGAILFGAAGMNPASKAAQPTNAAAAVSATAAATATTATASTTAAAKTAFRRSQVEAALDALESQVVQQSGDGAVRSAFQAYFNFQAAHPDEVRNPYLYYVDYGLDNRTPRGYVFDMEKLTPVDGPFVVAHGRGSSTAKNAVPTRFSNSEGSATTSLGLFVTQEMYGFSGHTGGKLYNSVGLRLEGVSGKFNDAARERRVVVHGAPYVTPNGAGRSEGCPAMELSRAKKLIPMIANGGMVFLYSPADKEWTSEDPWSTAAF
jgi:hypothetical protein